MSHVTLAKLEARMVELIKIRDARLCRARQEIVEANRQFDEWAVPLGKQINELRALERAEAEPSSRTQAAPRPVVLDGLTDEEQQHYHELLARKKG